MASQEPGAASPSAGAGRSAADGEEAMKCPRCNSEHTRLSWLREMTVTYWCTKCHAGFEVRRHVAHLIPATAPTEDVAENHRNPVARAV
jgi:predicted RNA-binding Zn-ribbon protein involved in translation (DUF1610 family)